MTLSQMVMHSYKQMLDSKLADLLADGWEEGSEANPVAFAAKQRLAEHRDAWEGAHKLFEKALIIHLAWKALDKESPRPYPAEIAEKVAHANRILSEIEVSEMVDPAFLKHAV